MAMARSVACRSDLTPDVEKPSLSPGSLEVPRAVQADAGQPSLRVWGGGSDTEGTEGRIALDSTS